MSGSRSKADEPSRSVPPDGEEAEGSESTSSEPDVPRVWDEPDDRHDPPSQRPEDTHEEARRRRRAG